MWDAHSKTVWAAFPDQGKTMQMTISSPVTQIYEYDAHTPHRTGNSSSPVARAITGAARGRAVAPVAAAAQVVGAKVFFQAGSKACDRGVPGGTEGGVSLTKS